MEDHSTKAKPTKKPIFYLILGIAFIVFSILRIVDKLMANQSITWFDGIYVLIFLLNGIYWLMTYNGYQWERLFSKKNK